MVLGWSMAHHRKTDLVVDAVTMACIDAAGRSRASSITATVRLLLPALPGVPDSHSDGHAKMSVPGAPRVS